MNYSNYNGRVYTHKVTLEPFIFSEVNNSYWLISLETGLAVFKGKQVVDTNFNDFFEEENQYRKLY